MFTGNQDIFTSSFPIFMPFISFSCLVALPTSSTMLYRSSESRNSYLLLGKKHLIFHPWLRNFYGCSSTPLPTHPSKAVYICSPPWIFHSSPVRVGHSALCPQSTLCLPFFQHLPFFPRMVCLPASSHRLLWALWKRDCVIFLLWIYST